MLMYCTLYICIYIYIYIYIYYDILCIYIYICIGIQVLDIQHAFFIFKGLIKM